MKRFFITLITMVCGAGYALPVGNPFDPILFSEQNACTYNPWWNARIGFYGDYVFERYGKLTGNENHQNLAHTSLHTNACLLVANMWNRVELFATLGATHIRIRAHTEALAGNNVFFETDTGFSWSVGGRGIAYRWHNWVLGIEAQYFSATPRVNFVRNEATFGVTPTINYFNKTVNYHEWQIGSALAVCLNADCYGLKPVPYLAVKWSGIRADFDGVSSPGGFLGGILVFDRVEEQHPVGFAVGMTLIGGCRLSINLEGRFADERAFSLNSQYRF
jgi:major outer membrane protein